MPYRTQNAVPVTQAYGYPAQFDPGAEKIFKIDVFVNGVDVLMQVLEWQERGWYEDAEKEMLLRRGFNSKPFLTPIWAWRFKQWPGSQLYGQGATVDIVTFS